MRQKPDDPEIMKCDSKFRLSNDYYCCENYYGHLMAHSYSAEQRETHPQFMISWWDDATVTF